MSKAALMEKISREARETGASRKQLCIKYKIKPDAYYSYVSRMNKNGDRSKRGRRPKFVDVPLTSNNKIFIIATTAENLKSVLENL